MRVRNPPKLTAARRRVPPRRRPVPVDVGDINDLPRFNSAAESASPTWPSWSSLPKLGKFLRHAEHCSRAHDTILNTKQHAKVRVANASRVFQHRLENRLKLAGRATDDLEHVSGRCLLLQRFVRSSLSSRVFSMAMTAWSAKVSASSICFCVNAVGVVRSRFTTPKTWPSRMSGTPSAARKPISFCACGRE